MITKTFANVMDIAAPPAAAASVIAVLSDWAEPMAALSGGCVVLWYVIKIVDLIRINAFKKEPWIKH